MEWKQENESHFYVEIIEYVYVQWSISPSWSSPSSSDYSYLGFHLTVNPVKPAFILLHMASSTTPVCIKPIPAVGSSGRISIIFFQGLAERGQNLQRMSTKTLDLSLYYFLGNVLAQFPSTNIEFTTAT